MVEWEADAAQIVLHRRILSVMSDLKIFLQISFPTFCSHMVGQAHLEGQSKFISSNYFPLSDGGTTP